jgi:hypothetical protein
VFVICLPLLTRKVGFTRRSVSPLARARGDYSESLSAWSKEYDFTKAASVGHTRTMNSFAKLTASVSALIASLSFAWLALTLTGMIPHESVHVYHDGQLQFMGGLGGLDLDITHSGSVEITH